MDILDLPIERQKELAIEEGLTLDEWQKKQQETLDRIAEKEAKRKAWNEANPRPPRTIRQRLELLNRMAFDPKSIEELEAQIAEEEAKVENDNHHQPN